MKKLVVNHLEKLFVTADAATIVAELEVAHPAAKLIVMAAKMQESEVRRRRPFFFSLNFFFFIFYNAVAAFVSFASLRRRLCDGLARFLLQNVIHSPCVSTNSTCCCLG